MIDPKILEKLKTKKTLDTKETKDFLLSVGCKFQETNEGIVCENLKMSFPANIFPLHVHHVVGDIDVSGMGLMTLRGVPSCGGNLVASRNNIRTLDGMSDFGKSLDVSTNPIFDINDLKKDTINGDLDLSFTHLSSYKSDSIKEIKGNLFLNDCKLSSFSSEVKIGKNLYLGNNFLITKPKQNNVAGVIDVEGNPCEPADSFDEARW